MRATDGEGRAFLCRSEHIVAWVMRGAQWQIERPWEVDAEDRTASAGVTVERVRSGQMITRAFDNAEELRAWASAGAFWSTD